MSEDQAPGRGETEPHPDCGQSCLRVADNLKCSPEGRRSCLIRARLFDDRGIEQDAIIRNVSAWKIGVTSKGEKPSVGHRVSLALSDGQILGGCVGVARDDYIDVELCRELDTEIFAAISGHRKEFLRDDAVWGISARHKVTNCGIDPSRAHRI